uniref:Phospholipid phosphatase 2 n=1 Tax=Ornithorhynchus anatinus TaxID=9258 RepID=A0A6I8N9W0_ORNAN
MERKKVFVLLDVLCVVVASLPFVILTLVNSPYKRGFYCSDDSIKYPYKPDTITHGLMAGVTITVTVLIITAGEAFLVYRERLYSRSEFNNYLAALYKVVGTFLFGAAVSQSLTDLAKYMIGRLRPNFLAVCDPDWSKVNCSIYIQLDAVCRGNPRNVTESRLSFYSGHSSFGMYCMVFLAVSVTEEGRAWVLSLSLFMSPGLSGSSLPTQDSSWGTSFPLGVEGRRRPGMPGSLGVNFPNLGALCLPKWGGTGPGLGAPHHELPPSRPPCVGQLYVQARLCSKWARLLRPTIQFFLFAFAVYVGYTRVADYKHHWSDVLVGLLQGALIAVLIVHYISDFFKARPPLQSANEDLERKPSLALTLNETDRNHFNYRGTS